MGVTLTHTKRGCILGCGLLVVHCWPSGLEWCVLASTMVLPLALVLEGSSGGGRHPLPHGTPNAGSLWPPHTLHRLCATYQAVLTVAEFISKGFWDYCSLIPVRPSNGCCLLPWMDMAMPCSSWSSLSHAGWGTDMAERMGQLFIPHALTPYSLFLLVALCRK